MSKMTLVVILALMGAVASAAVAVVAVSVEGAAETSQTAEAQAQEVTATASRADQVRPVGPPAGRDTLSMFGDDPAPDDTDGPEPTSAPEKDHKAAICDALAACSNDLPTEALRDVQKLEVVVHTWTLEDGGALIERVDLTSGREDTAEVDADRPQAQSGVGLLDDLATCISYSLDTDRLPTYHDALGRIAVNTTHTHPYGVSVPLDRGRIDETTGPCSDEPDPEPLRLVDVGDAPIPSPEDAVAVLGAPRTGPSHAAVRIIVCGAYTCRFCKESVETLSQIAGRYFSLSVGWLQLPLTQDAAKLAFAAVAAHRQNRFWEIHRALFEHGNPIGRSDLLRLAEENGLDTERFEADLDDPSVERQVAMERQVCSAAGAKATPTFFINGDLLAGERGVEEMAEVIDQILEEGPA